MRRRRILRFAGITAWAAVLTSAVVFIVHAEAAGVARPAAVGQPEPLPVSTPSAAADVPRATVAVPPLTSAGPAAGSEPASAAVSPAPSTPAPPSAAVSASVSGAASAPGPSALPAAAAPASRALVTAPATRSPAVATLAPGATLAPITAAAPASASAAPSPSVTAAGTPAPSVTPTSSFTPPQVPPVSEDDGSLGALDAVEPHRTATDAQVQAAVDAAVQQAADQGITEHVVVAKRSTGEIVTSDDADSTVPSMSLVKLFIATDLLRSNGGPSGLDAATLDRLRTMIVESDDGIAQDFYDADGADAIVDRTVAFYGLQDTTPTLIEQYWGDVQVSARDMATFLRQALASPVTGPWLEATMLQVEDYGSDGFDQDFGMNAIDGAGSKQGWGCCLGETTAIHSVGFDADDIVVVLSTSTPDNTPDELESAGQLMADPGAQAARQAVSHTARVAIDPSAG